jgi:hypothetical protein
MRLAAVDGGKGVKDAYRLTTNDQPLEAARSSNTAGVVQTADRAEHGHGLKSRQSNRIIIPSHQIMPQTNLEFCRSSETSDAQSIAENEVS